MDGSGKYFIGHTGDIKFAGVTPSWFTKEGFIESVPVGNHANVTWSDVTSERILLLGSVENADLWNTILQYLEAVRACKQFHESGRAFKSYNDLFSVYEEEKSITKRCKGQGYGLNAAERRVVELHAMDAAKKYFKKRGFDWEDTRAQKSYDLVCTKGNKIWYVEESTQRYGVREIRNPRPP